MSYENLSALEKSTISIIENERNVDIINLRKKCTSLRKDMSHIKNIIYRFQNWDKTEYFCIVKK